MWAYYSASSMEEKDFHEGWLRSIDANGGPEWFIPNFGSGTMYSPPALSPSDWKAVRRMCNGS